jgi:hypothetical protein
MNGKNSKKLRKENQRAYNRIAQEFVVALYEEPFLSRLKIAMNLILKKMRRGE